jgi:hypothetical protein
VPVGVTTSSPTISRRAKDHIIGNLHWTRSTERRRFAAYSAKGRHRHIQPRDRLHSSMGLVA